MQPMPKYQLTLHDITIPFKVSFKHASAERSKTQSVWVQARSSTGLVGHGESCPREYVTGESLASVHAFFTQHNQSITETVEDVAGLKTWMIAHEHAIDHNPAAWCAIELALLDVMAKDAKQSVEALLGLPELAGAFHYSAILGDSRIKTFTQQVQQYQALGFTDYKIKVCGEIEKDREKLNIIQRVGLGHYRCRLDANNCWHTAQESVAYLQALSVPLFAVEEPLRAKDITELAKVSEQMSIPVILDESFTQRAHFATLKDSAPDQWIINVRVSKMGGLLRALAVVNHARKNNIAVIVGAQVGETSLLTRAAMTVAQQARDILVAQEGAFGTWLLEKDMCDPVLMWGKRGELNIDAYQLRPSEGFGLAIAAMKT